jgi:hypothetical protein
MKIKYTLLLLFFFCKAGYSQVWFSTQANILLVNADSVWLEYGAYFQWGPGGPVDWLQGFNVENQNDTLYLKMYYSYPGVAIMGGSVTLDTVTVKPVPATAHYLSISSYWVSGAQDTTKNKDAFDTTIALIPTAVTEVRQTGSLLLFPNPVAGHLHILTAIDENPIDILIYNSSGNLVRRERYKPQIDLTALSIGLYTITVKTERGELRSLFLKE